MTMHVLDVTGDTVHRWDPRKPEEVEAVRTLFNSLKKQGWLAYTVTDGDGQGEVIREFDPRAGKIMMSRHPVGG
jgi:hypothetical protein